jgi:hypothetical protein
VPGYVPSWNTYANTTPLSVAETTGDYSQAVSDFIANASTAGLNQIIIDLQRNSGGTILLPFTTFKSFFPDLTPFTGSRRRSFPLANVIGTVTSEYWAGLGVNDTALKEELAANEWLINTRVNAATGKNFSGWPEYQGPIISHGDAFTLTERYDLANENFDAVCLYTMLLSHHIWQLLTPHPRLPSTNGPR